MHTLKCINTLWSFSPGYKDPLIQKSLLKIKANCSCQIKIRKPEESIFRGKQIGKNIFLYCFIKTNTIRISEVHRFKNPMGLCLILWWQTWNPITCLIPSKCYPYSLLYNMKSRWKAAFCHVTRCYQENSSACEGYPLMSALMC